MSFSMHALIKEAIYSVKGALPAGKFAVTEYNLMHMPVTSTLYRKNGTQVSRTLFGYDNDRKLMTISEVFADTAKKPKVVTIPRDMRRDDTSNYEPQYAIGA